MTKLQGFKPFIDNDSKILILGSFPSVKSRENGFYYGNKQNRFWKTLATIFQENVPITLQEKQDLCRKHKIALWDIVEESNLKGSSDQTLSKSIIKLADIKSLLINYPNISKILCNGLLAYNLFIKHFKDDFPVVKMPSTSPANTRFNFEIWKKELII